MKKIASAGVAAVIFSLASASAIAVDGVAIEVGSRGTSRNTDMGRAALQWDWNQRWLQSGEWHLGGYWDLSLSHWRHDALAIENGEITEIGLTPAFRLQRNSLEGWYLDAGIGLHLMSKTRIGNKRFSTQFQFGDHIGAGYRFGVKRAWDLGYRFQHLSNGGIKKPNEGIDFHQIRLQYHF